MNKAFVKETDAPDPRCPRCGWQGTSVAPATLAYHLPAEDVQRLAEISYFCPNPNCSVAYYDAALQEVEVSRMKPGTTAYPKDPRGPVCACFGLSLDALEHDAKAGVNAGVKALITRSQTAAADCVRKAPDARCCVPRVQQIFLQHHPSLSSRSGTSSTATAQAKRSV